MSKEEICPFNIKNFTCKINGAVCTKATALNFRKCHLYKKQINKVIDTDVLITFIKKPDAKHYGHPRKEVKRNKENKMKVTMYLPEEVRNFLVKFAKYYHISFTKTLERILYRGLLELKVPPEFKLEFEKIKEFLRDVIKEKIGKLKKEIAQKMMEDEV